MLAPTGCGPARARLGHPRVGAADDPVELGREPGGALVQPARVDAAGDADHALRRRSRRRAARSTRGWRSRRRRGRRRPHRRSRRRRCCGRRRSPRSAVFGMHADIGPAAPALLFQLRLRSRSRAGSRPGRPSARRIDSTISSIEPMRSKVKAVIDHRDRGGGSGTLLVRLARHARQVTAAPRRRWPTVRSAAMRILMLAQTYSPVVGGEERLVEDLSRQLAARGHEVTVATLRQPLGTAAARPRASGSSCWRARCTASPASRSRRSATTRRRCPTRRRRPGLRRLLRELRPDVVHAHNWLVNSYLPLARRAAPPLLLSLHDYGILCPTKRLFYKGGVCSGPGGAQVHAPRLRVLRRRQGGDGRRPARASPSPGCGAGSTCSSRSARRSRSSAGCGPRTTHRIVPNFVGELPPAPADADAAALLPAARSRSSSTSATSPRTRGAGNLIAAYGELADPPPLVLIGRQPASRASTERAGVVAPGPAAASAGDRGAAALALHGRPLDLGRALRHRRARGGRGGQADRRLRHRRPARHRRRRRDRAAGRGRRPQPRCAPRWSG